MNMSYQEHGHTHQHTHDGSCSCATVEQPVSVLNEQEFVAEKNRETVIMRIEGLDCGDCAANLEKAVGRIAGIVEANVNFITAKMKIVFDKSITQEETIIKLIGDFGYTAILDTGIAGVNKTVFCVEGMDCADCAAKLEKRIAGMNGVKKASVNFSAAKMTVEHTIAVEAIINVVDQVGYKAFPENPGERLDNLRPVWWKSPKMMATIISGVILGMATVLEWLKIAETVVVPLYIVAMLLGLYHVARSGYYSIRTLTPDMNFLMTIAALGAVAIGEWSEGATVVFLFSFGNALQAYTMDKTRESMRTLMNLAPREALVRRNGHESLLSIEEIVVGDVIIVKPGERIAMDGDVINGVSTVNQATITGEAMPVEKTVGDIVYAGTVNEYGLLEVAVTKLVGDSTLAKIMHLVEEAQAQKAPSQQFVDVFAKYYTPAVIIGAVGVWLIPWLILGLPFNEWFYRALVLLVISCPCALVISTPVSIVSAIGNASRTGVLIKGGAYLEEMSKIKAVAFDKTGTLTQGKLSVTNVLAVNQWNEDRLLAIAASVEKWSEHPIALAIVEKSRGLTLQPVNHFQALVGRGAKAEVAGKTVYVGNSRLFKEIGYDLKQYEPQLISLEEQGKTVLLIGTNDEIYGMIAVADMIRESCRAAIDMLRAVGIEKVAMLTGDNTRVARSVAETIGIDDYYGELLPENKVEAVQKISQKYGSVAMVGDGVNDTPALAAADVGIAMGVAGTDTALETADIALMSDDLGKLSYIIALSRKMIGIIKQNIVFSLVVKAAFVLLTVAGMANLWMAIFADTGAALLVTLNGMRLARKI